MKLNANYEKYANEFNLVKDYIAQEFPSESDKWMAVLYSSTYGLRIYDPDLDVIRIHGDRISFCTESGHYALVYSPYKNPTWLNTSDEKDKVKVKN